MESDQIGVFLPSLGDGPLATQMQQAVALGLQLVQPPLFDGMCPTEDTWKNLLSLANQHGLTISALSCYQDYTNPEGLEDRVTAMKKCLDYAVRLPNPVVITETGGTPFSEGETRAREWKTLIEAMKRCADHAGRVGAFVAMEPGGAGLVASVESMHALIEEVDHPSLRLNMDPANVVMFGGDPHRAARELGRHVIHTHAKDAVFHYTLTHDDFMRIAGKFSTFEEIPALLGRDTPPCLEVPLGEGMVDWVLFMNSLAEAGYHGPYIIEREMGANRIEDIRKVIELLGSLR